MGYDHIWRLAKDDIVQMDDNLVIDTDLDKTIAFPYGIQSDMELYLDIYIPVKCLEKMFVNKGGFTI